MVRDDEINTLMDTLHFGNLPDVIEIQTELPEVIHTNLMLGSMRRWLEIRDYYKRPVRIYAISDNPAVEKYVVGLVNNYKDMYITIIPSNRKEMLDIE